MRKLWSVFVPLAFFAVVCVMSFSYMRGLGGCGYFGALGLMNFVLCVPRP